MGKIQVLDEQLTNMIAAGEVVERPASVVKELVENAIDAGATEIDIQIEEGGLQLIRIVDDGIGMDREDCVKAFERHATSKIRTTRDLFHIRTLGFRGEALPSIASVSRMELISSPDSGRVGTRVALEGGTIVAVEDAAAVKGTDVRVRDLFYNTPARLKYMKSISTEVGHISDYVNRLALTYPDVAFRLSHNGKQLLATTGDGKLLHVMAAIYGVQVAKLLIPVEGETIDFRWSGFLSKIDVTRASRSYMTTLVNGRYIRSFPLANAILKGYHTLLPGGRYPIAVLHVEMDPVLVDVNVHPAKLEVRFSKEQELCEAIETSVRETLRRGLSVVKPLAAGRMPKKDGEAAYQPQFDLRPPDPEIARNKQETRNGAGVSASGTRLGQWLYAPVRVDAPDSPKVTSAALVREEAAVTESEPPAAEPLTPGGGGQPEPVAAAGGEARPKLALVPADTDAAQPAGSQDAPAAPVPAQESAPEENGVPPLYPVGQVHGTYIVAQNESGMYLIDQHAAQERIFYEHFMAKLAEESVASQMLLFPHTVELTAVEAERLRDRLDLLASFGLEVEWFGSRTLIVRAHPHWFPQGAELEVIDELIQYVLAIDGTRRPDLPVLREKAAIMMACKASIKANRYLTHAEMEALLERLRTTSSPFTCPHGRPIVIHFSTYDLEKMFKRVM